MYAKKPVMKLQPCANGKNIPMRAIFKVELIKLPADAILMIGLAPRSKEWNFE